MLLRISMFAFLLLASSHAMANCVLTPTAQKSFTHISLTSCDIDKTYYCVAAQPKTGNLIEDKQVVTACSTNGSVCLYRGKIFRSQFYQQCHQGYDEYGNPTLTCNPGSAYTQVLSAKGAVLATCRD